MSRKLAPQSLRKSCLLELFERSSLIFFSSEDPQDLLICCELLSNYVKLFMWQTAEISIAGRVPDPERERAVLTSPKMEVNSINRNTIDQTFGLVGCWSMFCMCFFLFFAIVGRFLAVVLFFCCDFLAMYECLSFFDFWPSSMFRCFIVRFFVDFRLTPICLFLDFFVDFYFLDCICDLFLLSNF